MEAVNHPDHYKGSKFEAIDIIEDYQLDFCLGNAIKYILRSGRKEKSKEIEDLEKAIWYVKRRIENASRKTATIAFPKDLKNLSSEELSNIIGGVK